MKRLLLLLCCVSPLSVFASPWQFEKPVAVTQHTGKGVFHHIDSSGRRSIAVSGREVAVVWEDNHDGTPRVYMAHKGLDDAGFTETGKAISGNGDAYEPGIAALPGDRFAVAWEEDGQVRVRVMTAQSAGPVLRLGQRESAQVSLAGHDHEIWLVAAEREKRFHRIRLHRLQMDQDLNLKSIADCPVDAQPPKDAQLYPALAFTDNRLVVAWEDRRLGHTIIMAASSPVAKPCAFTPAQRISAGRQGARKAPYGKGHGVARVTLAGFDHKRILAAWADKRNFREGYEIYGAFFDGKAFGDNVRIQDDFGSVAQQWHASASGDARGDLVVAWDDNRDGNAKIMLSWLEDGDWSDDAPLPGADGSGEHTHPAIQLDDQDNLHAVWVERDSIGGPTRLMYAFAPKGKDD